MINRKCPFPILGLRRRCRLWNAFPLLVLFVLASQCALFLIHAASYSITADNDLLFTTQSRDISDYINPDADTTRIQPKCLPDHTPLLLVTIVCSAPEHFDARSAIRKTWGRFLKQRNDSVIYFLLGSTDDEKIQDAITREAATSGDIIQEPFTDSYLNLTLKTVALLKWVTKNAPTAKFVLKIDDDMFLEPSNLVQYLQQSTTPLFSGYLYNGVAPIRDPTSKWYLPEIWFRESILPPFISGTCYVISADVISQLYATALTTEFINLEDVFLSGLVATRKLKMALTHHPGFHRNRPLILDACMLRRVVTIHEVPPKELEDLWGQMAHLRHDCGGSVYVRLLEMLYEWTS